PPDRDGMLGYIFLRNYLAVIDYGASQMRLYPADSTAPAECSKGRAPLQITPAGLAATLGTEFGRLHLAWDTGSPGNLLTAEALKIDPSADPYGRQVRLRNVTLGPVHIPLLSAQVEDLKIPGLDGLLGYDFFVAHRVCFDVKHKAVSIIDA